VARVELDAARAVVEYDPALADVDDLRDAVTEAGYTATLVG
jgi:copper chaperone CopZ